MNHCFARRSKRNFGISKASFFDSWCARFPRPRPAVDRAPFCLPVMDNLQGAHDGALISVCLVLFDATRLHTLTAAPSRSPSARCAKWACVASLSIVIAAITLLWMPTIGLTM